MPKFIYKAKKGPADVTKGSIEAETRHAAISRLSQMGYFPIDVSEVSDFGKRPKGIGYALFKKAGSRDVSTFTRQLSDLLGSGVTLLRALNVLVGQTENKYLARIVQDIHDQVKDGETLSQSLSRHPRVFSSLYVNMVRSGEVGGALEDVLNRLADFSEKEDELRSRVRAAMAYPLLMAVVGIGTIVVLLAFVIPKLVTMFEDMGQILPLPTRMLVSLSGWLTSYWWLIAALIFLIIFMVKRGRRSPEGRLAIDRLKLRIPLLRELILKMEIARFGRTLGTLLINGVPILQSIDVVSQTMTNEVLHQEVKKLHSNVAQGLSLTRAIKESSRFPGFVVNLVAVGEEGGLLERSLLRIADTYEREVDRTVKVMTSLLEPAIIIVMGGIVGFIVISMLLPIFQINVMIH